MVVSRDNDYSELEVLYRDRTGAELVIDPYQSIERAPITITKSVSVLIGTWNSCSSLKDTLLSLEMSTFNTKYPDQLKVIVVDDGSDDGTRALVLDSPWDLRLDYVRQRRAGLTAAHNTGAAFVDTDVVIFSDSDMVHTPSAIEELMQRHQLLSGVTLMGFRFEMPAGDPRLGADLPRTLASLRPAFEQDFRVSSWGRPHNMCRESRHLKDLGGDRFLRMPNGAGYSLYGLVVGAFFSLEHRVYAEMGYSDRRLRGWGCEDSLIAAKSIALGNLVIPVYSAASGHVSHPPRYTSQQAEFARNIATAQAVLDAPWDPPGPDRGGGGVVEEMVTPARRATDRGAARPLRSAVLAPDDDRGSGDYCYVLGRFPEAVERYQAAAKAAPDDYWSRLGLAKSLREADSLEESLETFAECVGKQPSIPWGHWEQAFALARAGRHHDARASMERAGATPDARWALDTSSEAHKRRGNEHAGQGFDAVAVVDFDLALLTDSGNVWARFDQAGSLRKLGRVDDARAALEVVVAELHPADGNRPWVHAELGEQYLRDGAWSQAKLQLEKGRRLDPGNERLAAAWRHLADLAEAENGLVCHLPIAERVASLPGWFDPEEVDLMLAILAAAERAHGGRGAAIVELGSFCGRSTVAIASFCRLTGTDLHVYAIDPHVGYEYGGGVATYQLLVANLEDNGVADRVTVIARASTDIEWSRPIALLFIDALHDYDNVRADFDHYTPFLLPGGFVAFHDYDARCPGVQRCGDQVLADPAWEFVAHRGSLLVVRRASVR